MNISFEFNRYLRDKLVTIPIIKQHKAGVYPLIVEQGTNYPYIIIERQNISQINDNKDYFITDQITFGVTIFSGDNGDSYKLSVNIAKELRNSLNQWYIKEDCVLKNCRLLQAEEGYSEGSFYQDLTFEIQAEKSL